MSYAQVIGWTTAIIQWCPITDFHHPAVACTYHKVVNNLMRGESPASPVARSSESRCQATQFRSLLHKKVKFTI